MVRLCECGCGEELPPNASAQMRHKPGHRQRKYQRKRDATLREALSAWGGQGGVKTTPRRQARGLRRRSRTPYVVLSRNGDGALHIVGQIEAHDRDAAKRALGSPEELIAVPVRSAPELLR